MPRNTPSPRVCHDCDGFASAAITTGTRNPDGTRTTLAVDCRACHGTGTTAPAAALIRTGR
ncbi:hypothetical protein EDD90_3810 [Streptomyces sp. Ag109_O5-1]|uniref:hypothetical protein n=1 Tax=Streptomyces sp. Ag109_O5-1 TaxID=1938851 RepID=UPI000F4E0C02|nr:hypothetical protein [Streptomyces sp. Ag109_O5-1]RPE40745.1 hypothetical protein EDD90_3810 [Streptomyces sp. Ag109_O5-1]